jgi:hypothetical protein
MAGKQADIQIGRQTSTTGKQAQQAGRQDGMQVDSQSGRQTDEKTNGQMQKTIYIVERKKGSYRHRQFFNQRHLPVHVEQLTTVLPKLQ